MNTVNQRSVIPEILVFATMTVLYLINYFLRAGIPGTIYTQIQQDYQLTATQMAMISSSYTYVYAFAQVFVGILVDRMGGIRITLIGGVIFALGALLFPISTIPAHLYLARMLTGLGSSTMFLSLVYEVNAIFGHKNYAVFMGIGYMAAYAGGMLATAPFAWICTKYPWKNVLLSVGMASLFFYILFVIFQFFYVEKRNTTKNLNNFSVTSALLELLKNKLSWINVNIGAWTYLIYFIIITVFGKKFLEDFAGMEAQSAARILFVMSIIVMATSLSSSLISRIIGNRRKPFILSAVCLTLTSTILMNVGILWLNNWMLFAFCYWMYALSAGMGAVITMSTQEVNSAKNNTLTTGFSNMYNYLMVAFMSLVSGLILDFLSPELNEVYSPKAYLTLFAVLLIPVVIMLFLALKVPETHGKYLKD